MTDTDYSNEVQDVVDALNAVYENKQANKKNSLDGDYSTDDASYPTCQAVKGAYGTRVTSWQSTPSDSNIPSEALVKTALDGKSGTGHSHATGDITNSATLSNIGSNLTNQGAINSALNTIIGTLKGTKFIEIVDTLPIASAETMGKLYIISETESGVAKVNVYYTKQAGTGSSAVYAMVKMDANILDSLSWNDISDKPSFGTSHDNFAYGDHSHGEISNGGAVTTTVDMATSGTADKILISDASDNNKVKATSQVLASQIKNTDALPGIGPNVSTQASINSSISTKLLYTPTTTDFVREVNSLPTASDETLGRVYAIPLSTSAGTYDNYDLYLTVEHKGSTKVYSWEKLGGEAIREVKSFAGQLAEAINPSS